MTTITDQRPASTPSQASREVAMRFHATGRTPALLRGYAADPLVTEGIAVLSGVTPGEARQQMLSLADEIDHITAEGITQEQAYFLMRLEERFGPYPGTVNAPDGKASADITRFAQTPRTARRA